MIDLMENESALMERHARLIEGRNASDADWLRSIRENAMQRFTALGFPTTKDESWRFTNVAPIAKTSFALAPQQPVSIDLQQLNQFIIPDLNAIRLVFVNGRYSPRLSHAQELPKGLRIMPLAQAMEAHRDLVRPHLEGHRLHAAQADAFTHMNTAFLEDGAFIHVARGKAIETPIELLSISTESDSPTMTHPRHLIIADESAELTVIERSVSLHGGNYFTNAVTDILVGTNATVNHYLLEEENSEAFNVSTLRTRQMADSRCNSHTVLLGGKLVRNNVHAILDGKSTECLINGLYIGSDSQHMDNHMRVEHAQPHGDSRQFYHGILNDRASAVFAGRIIVHPGAQKTDAKQTNRNLLLSDESHVDTQPQLEIYADDVKCTHGATIGQLDEQAVFYFRARGISNDTARSMLIHAFAGESVTRMGNPAIRAYVDNILFARLPGGDMLERML